MSQGMCIVSKNCVKFKKTEFSLESPESNTALPKS